MIIRNITSDGDWVFGKGKNDYKKEADALAVDIITRLKSWKGDCFFSDQEGVDYKSFLDRHTKTFLANDIRRVILQTVGVLSISSFEITVDSDRTFSVDSTIVTIYGELSLSL